MLVRRSHLSDDRGAIAVLAAILIVGLLIPLSALAMTTHVREGAAAELQRAAEAGALAGAASIPLADISFVNAYTSGTPLSSFYVPGAPNPLTIACDQAQKAIQADGDVNDAFSPNGTTLPANFCKAEYLADSGFNTDCLSLDNLISGLPLSGLLYTLLSTLNKNLLSVVPNLDTVVPGLLRPGVKVTLTRNIQGPFDGLLGGGSTAQVAESAAKRRFKNAIVVPALTPGMDLNPYVNNAVDAALPLVNQLSTRVDGVLGTLTGCKQVLTSLTADFGDLVNPPSAGAPTIGAVIQDAIDQGDQLMVLRVPQNPLGGLLVPFFEFVPVCVTRLGDGSIQTVVKDPGPPIGAFAGCASNAPGGFRASLVPVP